MPPFSTYVKEYDGKFKTFRSLQSYAFEETIVSPDLKQDKDDQV